MNKPHVHAAVIKAWADGATIQTKNLEHPNTSWQDASAPKFLSNKQYRVKPDNISIQRHFSYNIEMNMTVIQDVGHAPNVEFLFNPDTGKLISVSKVGD